MPLVLLDLTPLSSPSALRGIGRYVRGLVQGLTELADASPIQIAGLAARADLAGFERVEDLGAYVARPAQQPAPGAESRRNLLVTLRGQATARRFGASLLHLTEPQGLFFAPHTPYTVTCHDLIWLVLKDLYMPKVPGWASAFEAVERYRYKRPWRVLAVSHATERDLCSVLGVDPSRIDVVWHGVDHERFRPERAEGEAEAVAAALGSAEPYVLYLGAGDARRDLATLVAAFARSKFGRESRLVIGGRLSKKRVRRLTEQIRELGLERSVCLLDYVDEALVPALYRGAAVHVFPSRYEGFGLPVLEALACGAPTITSPGSSLDEVAGDAAAIVPVGEADALATALDAIGFDSERRQSMRSKGIERAKGFTWKACARGTLAFWQKALDAL